MTGPRDATEEMPSADDAEQAVLGALLLDNLAWDRVGDLLTDADFYGDEHRRIYAAIGSLVAQGKPADVVTVAETLKDARAFGRAEGWQALRYLNQLVQGVPSASNIRRHAEIVREKALLRTAIGTLRKAAAAAMEQAKPAPTILQDACEELAALAGQAGRSRREAEPLDNLIRELVDRVQELHDNGAQEVTGVRAGFYELDRMTSGLQQGDLIVLAARPSMGKTAFALNIAEHVAVQEGLPVLVFSMEMSAAQLALRMVGSLGRIPLQRLRTGRLTDDDWERLTEAVEAAAGASLLIDDTATLRVHELCARARRLARRFGPRGLGLIVVDYLQLIAGSGRENRATELGDVSRALKALARELQCRVLALSQLNRGVESRNDKRPVMSDLRDSGAIEQDADIVAFLYRDDYYDRASKVPGTAELIVAKHRSGELGTVRLAFDGSLCRFESLATGLTEAGYA